MKKGRQDRIAETLSFIYKNKGSIFKNKTCIYKNEACILSL